MSIIKKNQGGYLSIRPFFNEFFNDRGSLERLFDGEEFPAVNIVEGEKKCRNVNKLGKCLVKEQKGGLMNFDTDFFNDEKTGNYAKCRWAKKCHI